MGNSWIGLNDRDVDGTYTWADDTVFTYANWTNPPSSVDDCIEINTVGDVSWETVDCEANQNTFVCKRDSTSTVTTVGRFGELINERLDFQLLSVNLFFFTSRTLACGGEEGNAIVWNFSENSDLSNNEVLTATYSSTETGLSWLAADNTKQGYYQCQTNSLSYTIGLYDTSLTTVAEEGEIYLYIVGVDRDNVLLLCNTTESGNLSTIMWDSIYNNPINISSESASLPTESREFSCMRDGTTIVMIDFSVTFPEISVYYGPFLADSFSSTYPSTNEISIPLESKDISLSINLEGKWNIPGDMNTTVSKIDIPEFMEENAGLYTFYTNNWDQEEVIAMQIKITSAPPRPVLIPEEEFTFGDTSFAFTSNSTGLDWLNAQLYCGNWGFRGNLATIKSAEEDSLLFYSTDIDSYFSCWIGLNAIGIDAGTDASAFVWVDGSTSVYRNFDSPYPVANANWDCVRNRYRSAGGVLSNGWINPPCNQIRFCYLCSQPATPSDCHLIYNGSCYRLYEVSPGINWFDAQSSCAIWGGDLTSITTVRENNYLYTIIPDTVSKCWIGLNDRIIEGTYTWIDESIYSHTNWTGVAPSVSDEDCVEIIRADNGRWGTLDCQMTRNAFLCKRPSSVITDDRFGELTNGGLDFEPMSGNIFLYESLTLACGAEVNNAIVWRFSLNSDLSSSVVLTATYSSTQSRFSWLDIDNTRQGYYQCQISSSSTTSYTIGLFNETTTIAGAGNTYTYTVGIDREDVLLLCDPMDSSYSLSSLMWSIQGGSTLDNPINLFERSSTLTEQSNQLTCVSSGNTIQSNTINIYTPTITVSTSTSDQQYTTVYPGTNMVELLVGIEDFSISTNLQGRWKLPDATYSSSQTISYETLDYDLFGLYQFYIINWDGNEVLAIQAELIRNGYVVTSTISTSSTGSIQNDSTIVLKGSTMLQCSISNIEDSIQWYYSPTKDDMESDTTSSSTFTMETGISSLTVNSNEPGYYSCVINSDMVYAVFVVNTDSLVEITSFDNPSQQVDYDLDSAISLLYYSDDNIQDSFILWTTDNVENGDILTYSVEYPNPAPLSTVFNDVGAGVQMFFCFYRMSPVTLFGSVQLALKDTATITVTYEGDSMSFSDLNNPMFPSPQEISITLGTRNISLTCSLPECVWMIPDETTTTTTTYIISELTDTNSGTFSLMRVTSTGISYTTAHFTINPQEREEIAGINAVVIIIPVIIIVLLLLCIVVGIILMYFLVRNRGKMSKFGSRHLNNDAKASSEIPMKVNDFTEYKETESSENYNNACSVSDTINKNTNFTEPEIRDALYQNVSKLTTIEPPVISKKPAEVINPRMLPIPLDTYKMHMNKIWQREGALQEEYESFGGKEHRYPCTHAMIEENKIKNRFKLMYPYDKSRVILTLTKEEDPNSGYVNASHIPGVHVKEHFIAAQAPKENTLQDFWKMIVEKNVANIVMVTNLVESGRKKCEQYFPLKKGQKFASGPYEVIADKVDVRIGYTIRIMSVHSMGKVTQLKHFHFTAWPDHDVPTLHDELLLFVSKVQEGLIKPKAPILVHCSAGVGRTGTFITLYNLLAAIQQTKPINIYSIVHKMREHRPQMVQTFAQYKFIYLSVLEMILGSTSIPTEEFIETYDLYMQSETEGYVSVFFQQYSELNYQCEKAFDPVCKSALEPDNENKNPIKDILPCDSNRIVLESSPGDYINATSLDNGEIVVTINPTKHTQRDFYQLIYMLAPSLVVMLCSKEELQLIELQKSHRIVYWPKYGETLQTDSFNVTCEESEKTPHFVRNKLDITNNIDKSNQPVTQIITNQWNEKEEPNLESVIAILHIMLEFRKKFPSHPIIIHCDDGAGKSGVVYTVYRAIKDSIEKGRIDIFHIVKKLRNDRMNSVTTLTHFVSCFQLLNEYCSKVQ